MHHCGMAAHLQGVPAALGCLQVGRSAGSRVKSTLPSLPRLTTPATPAVKAAFSPAPHNSLQCHLIPFVPPCFWTALSSTPRCTSKRCTSLPPITKNISGKKKPYSLGSRAMGEHWDFKWPHWACGYDIRPLKPMAGTLIARVLCFLMDLWVPQCTLSVNS